MMQFLKIFFRNGLLAVLAVFAILGLPVLALVVFQVATEKCENKILGTTISPNGKWKLVRIQKFCSSDEDSPPEQFALLQPGESFRKDAIFFAGNSAPEFGYHVIVAKWEDDSNVAIAAPEPYDFKDAPKAFHGIHIHYSTYPRNPDDSKDAQSHRVINQPMFFKFRAEKDNGIGAPGSGCSL